MTKKIITWGGIAFLLFFIAFRPESVLDVLEGVGHTVEDIVHGFADFFIGLVE